MKRKNTSAAAKQAEKMDEICNFDGENDWINPEEVPEEAQVDDDSTAEKWTFCHEKGIEDFTITFDQARKDLLNTARAEVPAVLKNLGFNKNTKLEEVLKYFLEDILCLMGKNASQVAQRHTSLDEITRYDLMCFLKTELYMVFYQCGASELFNPENRSEYAVVNSEWQEPHSRVLECLSQPAGNHKALGSVDETFLGYERVLRQVSRRCFVPRVSIVALDDDKLKIATTRLSRFGINARKIDKGFGPVLHSVASLTTGIFLGGHLEKVGESAQDSISILLKGLVNAEIERHVVFPNLITWDRAYNVNTTASSIIQKQGDVVGTRRKEANFAFTFGGSKVKKHQKYVEEAGEMNAKWAKMKNFHGIAWRNHGRVVLLMTSKKKHGTKQWVFRKAEGSNIESGELPAPLTEKEFAETKLNSIFKEVNELTRGQADPVWFCLRKFKLTSSVSARFGEPYLQRQLDKAPAETLNDLASLCNVLGVLKSTPARLRSNFQKQLSTLTVASLSLLAKNCCKASVTKTKNKEKLIKLISSEITFEQIPSDLISSNSELRRKLEAASIEQVLHSCWFMSPLKKKALNVGKWNEPVVHSEFDDFMKNSGGPSVVARRETVGLLSSRTEPLLATSVDGLCVLREGANYSVAVMEIKTRSGNQAIQKQLEMVERFGRYISLKLPEDSVLFKVLVPEITYR